MSESLPFSVAVAQQRLAVYKETFPSCEPDFTPSFKVIVNSGGDVPPDFKGKVYRCKCYRPSGLYGKGGGEFSAISARVKFAKHERYGHQSAASVARAQIAQQLPQVPVTREALATALAGASAPAAVPKSGKKRSAQEAQIASESRLQNAVLDSQIVDERQREIKLSNSIARAVRAFLTTVEEIVQARGQAAEWPEERDEQLSALQIERLVSQSRLKRLEERRQKGSQTEESQRLKNLAERESRISARLTAYTGAIERVARAIKRFFPIGTPPPKWEERVAVLRVARETLASDYQEALVSLRDEEKAAAALVMLTDDNDDDIEILPPRAKLASPLVARELSPQRAARAPPALSPQRAARAPPALSPQRAAPAPAARVAEPLAAADKSPAQIVNDALSIVFIDDLKPFFIAFRAPGADAFSLESDYQALGMMAAGLQSIEDFCNRVFWKTTRRTPAQIQRAVAANFDYKNLATTARLGRAWARTLDREDPRALHILTLARLLEAFVVATEALPQPVPASLERLAERAKLICVPLLFFNAVYRIDGDWYTQSSYPLLYAAAQVAIFSPPTPALSEAVLNAEPLVSQVTPPGELLPEVISDYFGAPRKADVVVQGLQAYLQVPVPGTDKAAQIQLPVRNAPTFIQKSFGPELALLQLGAFWIVDDSGTEKLVFVKPDFTLGSSDDRAFLRDEN